MHPCISPTVVHLFDDVCHAGCLLWHGHKKDHPRVFFTPVFMCVFMQGASSSEVELDVLTGDWHVLRADVVMDVGNPLNPALDIGQARAGSGHTFVPSQVIYLRL